MQPPPHQTQLAGFCPFLAECADKANTLANRVRSLAEMLLHCFARSARYAGFRPTTAWQPWQPSRASLCPCNHRSDEGAGVPFAAGPLTKDGWCPAAQGTRVRVWALEACLSLALRPPVSWDPQIKGRKPPDVAFLLPSSTHKRDLATIHSFNTPPHTRRKPDTLLNKTRTTTC